MKSIGALYERNKRTLTSKEVLHATTALLWTVPSKHPVLQREFLSWLTSASSHTHNEAYSICYWFIVVPASLCGPQYCRQVSLMNDRTTSKWSNRLPEAAPKLKRLVRWLPTAAAPGSRPGLVKWDLWWIKWRWGRFSPSTSVSPANLHSTKLSIIIITRGRYNRAIQWPTCRVDPAWTPPPTMRIKKKQIAKCNYFNRLQK
jgi:hypothetical protein